MIVVPRAKEPGIFQRVILARPDLRLDLFGGKVGRDARSWEFTASSLAL
jgi:hypothetical protein